MWVVWKIVYNYTEAAARCPVDGGDGDIRGSHSLSTVIFRFSHDVVLETGGPVLLLPSSSRLK